MTKKITDLGENEVIHTPTEAEAIAICQLMHDAGLKWSSGGSLLDYNNWDQYKEKTCYSRTVTYAEFDFYKAGGYTIHPASDFLQSSFYQPEPEVGQLWEWNQETTPIHIKGKPYEILAIVEKLVKPCNVLLRCEEIDNPHYMDEEWLRDNFRFHSHPKENMIDVNQPSGIEPAASPIHDEPISDRKRESFRFYDMLPPELAKQAKENFDEGYCDEVPTNLKDAIHYGWWIKDSKHGDYNEWKKIALEAQEGKYPISEAHSDVVVDPMKYEEMMIEKFMGQYSEYAEAKEPDFDLYNRLDDNGKRVMREMYGDVFPKVKEYLSYLECGSFLDIDLDKNDSYVLHFKNCTPEIDNEKGEIRFVKN